MLSIGRSTFVPDLQALNVTLNVLEKHFLDRDLTRSGNSIVFISAGTGVFEVDGRLSGELEWLCGFAARRVVNHDVTHL